MSHDYNNRHRSQKKTHTHIRNLLCAFFPTHVIWCWRRTNEFSYPSIVSSTHHTWPRAMSYPFFFIGSLNDHQYFYLVVVSLSWNPSPIVNTIEPYAHANNNDAILSLRREKNWRSFFLLCLLILVTYVTLSSFFFSHWLCSKSQSEFTLKHDSKQDSVAKRKKIIFRENAL